MIKTYDEFIKEISKREENIVVINHLLKEVIMDFNAFIEILDLPSDTPVDQVKLNDSNHIYVFNESELSDEKFTSILNRDEFEGSIEIGNWVKCTIIADDYGNGDVIYIKRKHEEEEDGE